MKKPTYKVRSIGGTLAVTIPANILQQVPLVAGDEVEIDVARFKEIDYKQRKPKQKERARITIEPVKTK